MKKILNSLLFIYKFKEMLGRYGADGILIHHENKDPLAKGIAKVSGNARITAAVWGILQLGAVDPNNEQDLFSVHCSMRIQTLQF